MKYLVVDAGLSGTGIRNYYEGDFIEPEDLALSPTTVDSIKRWLANYQEEYFGGYKNEELIIQLDMEGKSIALEIKNELGDVKLSYFSDARMTTEII